MNPPPQDRGSLRIIPRAYQLLVDAGHGDRARRYLYDRPETCVDMTLTGPGERPDDYLAAYASVFGEGT